MLQSLHHNVCLLLGPVQVGPIDGVVHVLLVHMASGVAHDYDLIGGGQEMHFVLE